MSGTFTIPTTPPEQTDAILTRWTPLRRLVDESSPYLVIAELVDIVGELEERAEGGENYRWARCGEGLKLAKQHADDHWRDSE